MLDFIVCLLHLFMYEYMNGDVKSESYLLLKLTNLDIGLEKAKLQ